MSEQKPAIQPGTIEFVSSPNRQRILRCLAVSGIAITSLLGATGELADAQTANTTPDPLVYTAPLTMMPELGVKITCDDGCDGTANGNYPLDKILLDMQKSGIQEVDKAVNLEEGVVDVKGLAKNYTPSNCTADNAFFNLTQLDQTVNGLNSIGVDVELTLDSTHLADIDPKEFKCITYTIAKHFDGQSPTGPGVVLRYSLGNEENDPNSFTGSPAKYAALLQAGTDGILAGNKDAEVAMGALRDDGVGEDPGDYEKDVANDTYNLRISRVEYHEYPRKQGGKWQAVLLPAATQDRQDVNSAWPARAYYPGAQYGNKIQDRPLIIRFTESGWNSDLAGANGVSLQEQARRDARDIKSLQNNTVGVDGTFTFKFVNDPADSNWQEGVVYEKPGPAPGKVSVVSNTPMMRMYQQLSAASRQANAAGR